MEEKKSIRVSLGTIICIIIIILLLITLFGMWYHYNLTTKHNTIDTNINVINTVEGRKNLSISNTNSNEITNTVTSSNKITNTVDSSYSYSIKKIRNIYDVISDNDTEVVKAQKIAKEVMNAVNDNDWYYLAKMVGMDADYFIKYGIKNYKIDINNYKYDTDLGEYIFEEEYDCKGSNKDIGLGHMLIIKFEQGGKITIDPNCTGM